MLLFLLLRYKVYFGNVIGDAIQRYEVDLDHFVLVYI